MVDKIPKPAILAIDAQTVEQGLHGLTKLKGEKPRISMYELGKMIQDYNYFGGYYVWNEKNELGSKDFFDDSLIDFTGKLVLPDTWGKFCKLHEANMALVNIPYQDMLPQAIQARIQFIPKKTITAYNSFKLFDIELTKNFEGFKIESTLGLEGIVRIPEQDVW